jgi:hypothetical protein
MELCAPPRHHAALLRMTSGMLTQFGVPPLQLVPLCSIATGTRHSPLRAADDARQATPKPANSSGEISSILSAQLTIVVCPVLSCPVLSCPVLTLPQMALFLLRAKRRGDSQSAPPSGMIKNNLQFSVFTRGLWRHWPHPCTTLPKSHDPNNN